MKYLYVVMDGRAQFDIDWAAILECCGNKKPSWKSLREDALAYAARMVEKYQAQITDNTLKLLND